MKQEKKRYRTLKKTRIWQFLPWLVMLCIVLTVFLPDSSKNPGVHIIDRGHSRYIKCIFSSDFSRKSALARLGKSIYEYANRFPDAQSVSIHGFMVSPGYQDKWGRMPSRHSAVGVFSFDHLDWARFQKNSDDFITVHGHTIISNCYALFHLLY